MSKQELFEQIVDQFEILNEENGKTTKASQARARKAAGEIKKLITPYKKASVAESRSRGVFSLSTKSSRAFFKNPSLTGGVFFYL